MSEWQPIETAPKDGRAVLAWRFYPVVIYWCGDAEYGWEAIHLDGYSKFVPNGFVDGDTSLTHWMPLPEPPEN